MEFGKDPPKEVNVVIEIPKGSSIKFEIDTKTGVVTVDRILPTAMAYPGNYGFIPRTESEDGDTLDVLILGSEPFTVGSVVAVNPIGVLLIEDRGGRDNKIIAKVSQRVDPSSPRADDIEKVEKSIRKTVEHFFKHYKDREPDKYVKIKGWNNREAAYRIIRNAIERYANGDDSSSELKAEASAQESSRTYVT